MFKFTFILVSVVCCANGASFSYDQLKAAVLSNLRYLNSLTTPLNQNATEYIAYSVAEIYQIRATVEKFLTPEQQKDLADLLTILNPSVDESIQDNSCDPRTTALYPSFWWATTGNYTFTRNRLPSVIRPVKDSLYQIYLKSIHTEYGRKCNQEIFVLNNQSFVDRECISPCQEMLDNSTLECGISTVDDRTSYLINGLLLNCTQFYPEYNLAKMITYCTYFKRQVLSMFENRYDPQFDDIRYYYLFKIAQCGPFGITDFYTFDIVPEIVNSINCDGSVGSSRRTLEEKSVLTAQTAAVLISVMRFVLEEIYGVVIG